jgi:glycosyltransferase involved in cell wall biosynthesis
MKVGLNLLHAMPEIGGGWNYIQNLIWAIGECKTAHEYVAYVTDYSDTIVADNSNIRKVRVKVDPRIRAFRVAHENTLLQLAVHKDKINLLHWFANTCSIVNPAPAVVTVYDLQRGVRSSLKTMIKTAYFRAMMQVTVRNAMNFLPMSSATAGELSRVNGISSNRMTVVPPILNDSFRRPHDACITEFRNKYNLPTSFWLYVSHFYPHKNHIRLLKAYAELKSTLTTALWPLILRGDSRQGFQPVLDAIRELGLQDDVRIMPRLKDDEMPVLYAAASALVFPSLYEGGGIPILEAMACGCPILASNLPSIFEYADDVPDYFEPTDTSSIYHAMMKYQCNGELRGRKRAQGLQRCALHRKEVVIDDLSRAYDDALQNFRLAKKHQLNNTLST